MRPGQEVLEAAHALHALGLTDHLLRVRVHDAVQGQGDVPELVFLELLVLGAVRAAVGVELDAHELGELGLDRRAWEEFFWFNRQLVQV
ncbi:MAG: hypothetical protein QM706_19980 [Nitrospira sp.]